METIIGTDGRDLMDLSGPGGGTAAGGKGSDVYIVDDPLDTPVERVDEGRLDTVRPNLSWTLGPNLEVLIFAGGDFSGTGNALPNRIIATAGANLLAGGDGGDFLMGGLGKDTLLGGAGKDTLSGFIGADTLRGGLGDDLLRGGNGNDRLSGGTGSDAFLFTHAPNPISNLDTITDFAPLRDKIRLDDNIFSALTEGALAPEQFHAGAGVKAAQDADDRIVYNTTTGTLYYDADGAGGTAAVAFAVLSNHAAITASDFVIVA